MNFYTIDTGLFKLDGGAMFGVVPKSMWNKLNPADDNNMCTWAMRCLLVEDGNKLMLVDTGMGDKQDDKFKSHFYPHGEATLMDSIKKQGFSPDDITDVFLTHLHFDHCGGAIERDEKGSLNPAFKNASYWSCKDHWETAVTPNSREKASFLKENILPIQESGQLKFVEDERPNIEGMEIDFVHGHTEAMMLPSFPFKDKRLFYAADLIPSRHHIKMPYIMAYDLSPMSTLAEKKLHLNKIVDNQYFMMLEHDKDVECCTVKRTDRGFVYDEGFDLKSV